jgi:hypothetical protein
MRSDGESRGEAHQTADYAPLRVTHRIAGYEHLPRAARSRSMGKSMDLVLSLEKNNRAAGLRPERGQDERTSSGGTR